MFKSHMIKKNIELELQALILLQAQLGLVKSLSGDKNDREEDEIMSIVIRKSKDEYDALINNRQRTNNPNMPIQRAQDLEMAKKIIKSEEISENLKNEFEQQDYLNRKITKDAVLNGTIQEEIQPKAARPISARKNQQADLKEAEYNLDKLRISDNKKRSVSNLKLRQEEEEDDDDVVQASTSTSSTNQQQIVNNLAMNYLQTSGVNSEAELTRRAECIFYLKKNFKF